MSIAYNSSSFIHPKLIFTLYLLLMRIKAKQKSSANYETTTSQTILVSPFINLACVSITPNKGIGGCLKTYRCNAMRPNLHYNSFSIKMFSLFFLFLAKAGCI